VTYKLTFHEMALKEWQKLSKPLQVQFKSKLSQRLTNPHVLADKLSGHKQRYKIKLRSSGYRLVYSVDDTVVTVMVIAIGKRERNKVYKVASGREDSDLP